jgi:hypothetical protein
LSRDEVIKTLTLMKGEHRLLAHLLYGTVSRASEFSPVWQFKFPHPVENCRRVIGRARP